MCKEISLTADGKKPSISAMEINMNKDLDHLKLLSIFHYVFAGLCIFPLLYGVFYMIMGIFFGAMIANAPNSNDAPPAILFGGIFVFLGAIISIVALVVGILVFKAGRNLGNQTSYTYCFVVACVCCVFMPLGTILGVFSLVVLMRDSVKQLFDAVPNPTGINPSNWQ